MRVKKNDLNLFIYFLVIITQVFTINYESAGLISYLKYIICIIGIIYSFILMISQESKNRLMKNEVRYLLIVPTLFLLISLFKIVTVRHFSMRLVNELMFMYLPILYAYGLINTLNFKQIEKAMFGTLIISFLGYLFNLNLNREGLLAAVSSISFSNSQSAFESSQFAGTSIAVALFYLYYRKNKLATFLSVLFVILTFKRLAILTVIILIVLPKIIDLTKPASKSIFRIFVLVIFLLSILYFKLMIPENRELANTIFKNGIDNFTMGRHWRFSLLYNNPRFVNYGLGSTYDFLEKLYSFALEMDICRLFIEIGYIGTFVFIYNYFYSAKKNMYCMLLMSYLFFNMITSHCLAAMFTWIIVFITIGTIEYINPEGAKPIIKFVGE